MGRQKHPGGCEHPDRDGKVEIEPEEWGRQNTAAPTYRFARIPNMKSQQLAKLGADGVPKSNREGCPQDCR